MPTTESQAEAIHFASSLSTEADWRRAVDEVCRSGEQLSGPPDLALLFASHHYTENLERLVADVCRRIDSDRLMGCTGESIVGPGREVEGEPALSLWLARLPGVSVQLMHLTFERTPEGGAIVGWPDSLSDEWPPQAGMLLVGEPFSFPADYLLQRLNDDQRDVRVIGGMASGGSAPGDNKLFLGRQTVDSGAIAALIHGPVRLRTIVSQGCRPIGQPYVITKAEQNMIMGLGGKSALGRLQEVFATLPTREQMLVQQGLHVGRVVSEYQDHFEQGDFLVRNVMGIDRASEAIVIGDYVRPGQTVQFHLRDEKTADDDLRQLLARVKADASTCPRGALLFTCNGRGTRMFAQPDHDASAIRDALGEIPLAGFFAQGELGPVGGKNFVHGFTASIVIFEPRDGEAR